MTASDDERQATPGVAGRLLSATLDRRRLLVRSSVLGAAAISATLLAACGSDDDDDPTATASEGGGDTATNTPGAGGETPEATGEATMGATEPAGEATEPSGDMGEGVPGGELRVGLNADLTTMDPHMSTAAVDRQVYQLIFDKLVDINETLEIVPELATSWDISDDGMEYTFTLVENATFHDGEPFNAEAMQINFERMLDEATASPRLSEIAQIESIEVVDEFTLTLGLTQPFSPLLANLSDRAGMPISPLAITELGDDLARQPVGTGAFVFVEWVEDDHLTVEKNASWWQEGLPYLDTVTYIPITDATVRLTALQTNDVQLIDGISAKDVESVEADDSLVYSEVAGLGFSYIHFNATEAPFDNMALRQAVAWTLDRDSINETLFFGTGDVGQTPIPPSSWAYDESLVIYQQDYDMARQLLEEAGMPDGFEFTMLVTNTPDAIQLAEAFRAQIGEAGITANLELLEFGTLLEMVNERNFQSVSLGWSGRPDPDGNIYSYFVTDGGNNRAGYSNTEVDELLNAARATSDNEERKQIYAEACTIIAEEAPMIFVRFPAQNKVWQPAMQGYVHVPDGMMRLDKVWLEQG